MSRSRPLLALAGLLLLVAGCVSPDRVQSQLEFERLREQTLPPEKDKILPDLGTDPWTEEAFRPAPEDPRRG